MIDLLRTNLHSNDANIQDRELLLSSAHLKLGYRYWRLGMTLKMYIHFEQMATSLDQNVLSNQSPTMISKRLLIICIIMRQNNMHDNWSQPPTERRPYNKSDSIDKKWCVIHRLGLTPREADIPSVGYTLLHYNFNCYLNLLSCNYRKNRRIYSIFSLNLKFP